MHTFDLYFTESVIITPAYPYAYPRRFGWIYGMGQKVLVELPTDDPNVTVYV